jgi:hypothetical protein
MARSRKRYLVSHLARFFLSKTDRINGDSARGGFETDRDERAVYESHSQRGVVVV